VGLLQARRERKRGFQVPSEVAEDIVGELESKCVMCRVLSVVVSCRSTLCPLRRGSSPSFYRPRRERITCMPRLFSYMGKCGAPRRRVGGRLDGPCRDLAIMAYLVPE
jgi:transposase